MNDLLQQLAARDATIVELTARIAALEADVPDPLQAMTSAELKAYVKQNGYLHLTTGNGLSADAVQLYERRLLAIQTDGTDAGMAAVSAQLLAAHPTVARLKIVCEDRGIPASRGGKSKNKAALLESVAFFAYSDALMTATV